MAKYCEICGDPIYGRARKYCPECKKSEHLEQMHKYYIDNTSRWQYGGDYYDQQKHNKFGTGGLGAHALKDHDDELKKIEKEMINIGLRKPIK